MTTTGRESPTSNLSTNIYSPSILKLVPKFLDHARYELNRAPSSINKYQDCLANFVKRIGDLNVTTISFKDIVDLKKSLREDGIGEKREASIINTLRIFLKFCQEQLVLDVLDYTMIRPPKIPRRIPEYLTDEELSKLIKAIRITNAAGSINKPNMRFRTIVELILATGVRISEALRIKISDINFELREIKIIGKGDKERIVYLTPRAISWIRKYLQERQSNSKYLFVTRDGKNQLKVHDLWRYFKRYRELINLDKKATAHSLRRTFATKLRDNGVDITTVSELLGHADIHTTAKYYIGSNQKKNKEAHQKFLSYDI
jgi:integrase/recombinase XerD